MSVPLTRVLAGRAGPGTGPGRLRKVLGFRALLGGGGAQAPDFSQGVESRKDTHVSFLPSSQQPNNLVR